MKRLEGEIALITGAAQGLGRGIAKLFANEGAKVYLADINNEELKKFEKELVESGYTVSAMQADISNLKDIQRMVDGAIKKYGGIDILINNAGIAMCVPFLELTEDKWDRVMGINLKGMFFVIQSVARTMIKRGKGGIIINIGSISSEEGQPLYISYAASKAAIKSMTRSVALELVKYNIRVNSIAPGAIEDTPGSEKAFKILADLEEVDVEDFKNSWKTSIPLKRFAKTEEIARAVLFLCSDDASYIIGQTYNVCGGLTAR